MQLKYHYHEDTVLLWLYKEHNPERIVSMTTDVTKY